MYCDFESQTTQVLHDSEFQIKIEHCEEIGCAVYNLSYSAPMDQIQSLIQLSDSCSQSLVYGCFLAPLQEEGVDLGFWADKEGKKKKVTPSSNVFQNSDICRKTSILFPRRPRKSREPVSVRGNGFVPFTRRRNSVPMQL